MSEVNAKLIAAVDALPEFYQPVYGHIEWNNKPLRKCEDRLPYILKVYNALSDKLQRPLRVLDLGCAQGFFSFNIAAGGGYVTGVDLREENITLGNILAEENKDCKIKFIRARIEEFVSDIVEGEYDLVLMLSVLHNMSKYLGVWKVQNMVAELSRKIPCAIVEFALEKVHASYIPKNYRDFLPGYPFIRTLFYSDHRKRSNIKRRCVLPERVMHILKKRVSLK